MSRLLWWLVSVGTILVGMGFNIATLIGALGDRRIVLAHGVNGARDLISRMNVRGYTVLLVTHGALLTMLWRRWWHWDDQLPVVSSLAFLVIVVNATYASVHGWHDRHILRWFIRSRAQQELSEDHND